MRNYIALFACSFAFLGFVRGVPAFNRLLSLDDDLSLPKGVALAFQDRGAEQGGINILVTRPTQTAKDLEDIRSGKKVDKRFQLPRGKGKKGENPEQTVLRELREETGHFGTLMGQSVVVTEHAPSADREKQDVELHAFLVKVPNGQIPTWEGQPEDRENVWVPLGDFKQHVTRATMLQIIKGLQPQLAKYKTLNTYDAASGRWI